MIASLADSAESAGPVAAGEEPRSAGSSSSAAALVRAVAEPVHQERRAAGQGVHEQDRPEGARERAGGGGEEERAAGGEARPRAATAA